MTIGSVKPKMAQSIGVFLCEQCASVHIGFWRNGKMYAEAIPDNIEAVAAELNAAIEESRRRQRGLPAPAIKH